MQVEIVEARLEHAIEIVERLRRSDAEGVRLVGKESAEHIVAKELAQSFLAFTALADGKVAAMWGAKTAGVFSDEAYIWLLGTTLIEDHPVRFLRHSRRAIDELKQYFPRLRGVVLSNFSESIKWLQWLGFEVDEPVGGLRTFHTAGSRSQSSSPLLQ